MKQVLVIQEKDLDDNEQSVIGVADSVEKAEEVINKYYGNPKELSSHKADEDPDLEYIKILEVKGVWREPYKVQIRLDWFDINRV